MLINPRVRVIMLTLALGVTPYVAAGDGPKCIGKICLNQKLVQIKDVTRRYGHTKLTFGSDRLYLCYRVGKDAFLRVGHVVIDSPRMVTDVLLSKNQPCPPFAKASLINAQLKTEAGIGLGSSRNDVRARYGEPFRIVRGDPIYHRWLGAGSGVYYDPQPVDELWQYSPRSDSNDIRGFVFVGDEVVGIQMQVY